MGGVTLRVRERRVKRGLHAVPQRPQRGAQCEARAILVPKSSRVLLVRALGERKPLRCECAALRELREVPVRSRWLRLADQCGTCTIRIRGSARATRWTLEWLATRLMHSWHGGDARDVLAARPRHMTPDGYDLRSQQVVGAWLG